MEVSAYPENRETEIEWLKELPEHWTTMRLRFSINSNPVKSEVADVESDEPVSFVPMDAVGEYGGMTLEKDRFIGDVYSGYTYFKDNDVVVAKITPCFENGKGAIAENLTNEIGFGTTEFHVLRALKGYDYRWLFYLTITYPFRQIGASEMLGAGGQKRIPETFVKDFRVGFPPLAEQQQIANFLDYKTTQIDQLIAKKKALIEKLNEKRIAVITQAVTKGLDPTVPMRDSEVEWLGEVPAHWDVRRLKFLASEPLQYGANEAAELDDRDLPRYIRITDVKEDGTLHENTFRSLLEEVAEPYLLKEGDILLARSGATVGKSFQYKESWGIAAYAGYLIRFRTDNEIIDETFAYFFFRTASYWANINSTLIQSTIQNFSAEKYANVALPLPSLVEQKEIVAHMLKVKTKIDDMEKKAKKIVSKLEEYRISLITAAVTGKIDVRNVEVLQEA